MGGFLILIVIAAVFWLVFVLPRRRSQTQHASMQNSVDVGDEIITAGGIHAVVQEAGEDELRVEIAPGTVVRLDRRAVAAVARDVPEETPAQEDRPEAS